MVALQMLFASICLRAHMCSCACKPFITTVTCPPHSPTPHPPSPKTPTPTPLPHPPPLLPLLQPCSQLQPPDASQPSSKQKKITKTTRVFTRLFPTESASEISVRFQVSLPIRDTPIGLDGFRPQALGEWRFSPGWFGPTTITGL